jgi:RNA polymerase sigma-70 factor (ECF subfamily)
LSPAESRRASAILDSHFTPLFRAARRLGLTEALAEEAAQEALLVFVQRIADVAVGAERAFLFGTVTRIAANLRKAAHLRNELAFDPTLFEFESSAESAVTLFEQKEARDLLDDVLAALAPELREIFVLYEIEQLTMVEIASALGIKLGTVGSRLHRARRDFDAALQRRAKAATGSATRKRSSHGRT